MSGNSLNQLTVEGGHLAIKEEDQVPVAIAEEINRREQGRENKPGSKKGKYEWLVDAEFAFDCKVHQDRVHGLMAARIELEKKLRETIHGLKEEQTATNGTMPDAPQDGQSDEEKAKIERKVKSVTKTLKTLEGKIYVLSEILAVIGPVPTSLVDNKEDRDAQRVENEEIERKLVSNMNQFSGVFRDLVGKDLESFIEENTSVMVGILKRKGYPLCEVMTPDAKQRIGFVGFVAEEEHPFRKIDWSKDQVRMSVIFRSPTTGKAGEKEQRLRIPRELKLRFSNLNPLNGVIKRYIEDKYEPFNSYVNDFQRIRFEGASDEHVDVNGIKWVKASGQAHVTAVDTTGKWAPAGTVLGTGKIIRTRNKACFTWWDWAVPGAPRNQLIIMASEEIIRIASKATVTA